MLGGLTSWLDQWSSDYSSVTTVVIALVAGSFTFYRFRSIPSERRRETLDAMHRSFASSSEERAHVLPLLPAFLADGKNAVEAAVAVAAEADRRSMLQGQLDDWKGVTKTSANEILQSEVKFRSLLWATREARTFGSNEFDADIKKSAMRLVAKLTDFAQLVELDLFRQQEVLAQFHRAIAPACKAVEPLIWSRLDGRWGLRVPRLMLRAEYYNDAKSIHRTSDITWQRRVGSGPRVVLIRERLFEDRYGRATPTKGFQELPRTERGLLWVGWRWSSFRGSYGGSRLRRHARRESVLRGWLKYAEDENLDPLDVDGWDFSSVKRGIEISRVRKDPLGSA